MLALLLVVFLLILFLVLLVLLILLLLLLLLQFLELLFHEVVIEFGVGIVRVECERAFIALDGPLPQLLRLWRFGFAEAVTGISQIVERALLQGAVGRGGRTFK